MAETAKEPHMDLYVMNTETTESRTSLDPLPLVRAILLSEIWDNPKSSGYDLMKLTSELTGFNVEIQSGTVYGELRAMEEMGLVTSEQEDSGRRRREYKIAEEGKRYLDDLQQQIRARVKDVLEPLLSLMSSLTES
ncbi:MAG: PadR family transcriptional regulator [Candidatus Thorarchaeota archaeon]|nr:PadR family transcriptional regulator [Candidatus Thorarchaeota archaeon]